MTGADTPACMRLTSASGLVIFALWNASVTLAEEVTFVSTAGAAGVTGAATCAEICAMQLKAKSTNNAGELTRCIPTVKATPETYSKQITCYTEIVDLGSRDCSKRAAGLRKLC